MKNLQELVYKQGQAGITKATVTLVFNNERTEYLIQGHSAQVNQVQNLFHSVQLNVNNPHFLIMQVVLSTPDDE